MSLLDPSKYYQLSLDSYNPYYHVALETYTLGPGVLYMSPSNTTNTNWQFLEQDGIYFIRNYNYNNTWQLGITNAGDTVPFMQPASTSVSQQWFIERWPNETTKLKLMNRLVSITYGDDVYMSFVPELEEFSLLMSNVTYASRWSFTLNLTVGEVPTSMQTPYPFLQTAIPSQTPPTTSSVPNVTPSAVPGASSNHFNGLDAAGVAVGIVVFIAILVGGFFMYRQYKRNGNLQRPKAPGPRLPPRHGQAQVISEPPPAYGSGQGASFASGGPAMRSKAADEESIELSQYGSPSVEAKDFV